MKTIMKLRAYEATPEASVSMLPMFLRSRRLTILEQIASWAKGKSVLVIVQLEEMIRDRKD